MDQIQLLWAILSAFFVFSLCRHSYHLGLMSSVGVAVGGFLVGYLLGWLHYRVTSADANAQHKRQIRPFVRFGSTSLVFVGFGMFLYVAATLVIFVHSIISR